MIVRVVSHPFRLIGKKLIRWEMLIPRQETNAPYEFGAAPAARFGWLGEALPIFLTALRHNISAYSFASRPQFRSSYFSTSARLILIFN